ncbi:MAG: DUF6265 family protein [Acidobacteriota bacterium]
MFRLILLTTFALGLLMAQATSEVADLGWMAGRWMGPAGRAQSEEYWIAPAGGAMLGIGRTISGGRMAAFEFLRIEKRPDGIYYVAQPGGNPPTDFKLTRSSASEAVFENPKHDHPKIIVYRLDGPQTLVATLEGDEGGQHKKQEFRFQRVADAAKP